MEKKETGKLVKIIFAVEVIILIFGMAMSISGLIPLFDYGLKYIRFIQYPIYGALFIIILIILYRKKQIVGIVFGMVFIIAYMLVGGYGCFHSLMEGQRAYYLASYTGKEVYVNLYGAKYVWDGKSVAYEIKELDCLDKKRLERDEQLEIFVDGERIEYPLSLGFDNNSTDIIYFQLNGSGSGGYLELRKVEKK